MEEANSKRLSFLRITFIVFLIMIPAFLVTMATLRSAGPLTPLPSLRIVAGILAIFGALCIAAAYGLPVLVRKKGRAGAQAYNVDIFLAYLMGAALLESVAVYGFIIGLLGGNWLVVIPFFAAAAFGLLHRFPKRTIFRTDRDGDQQNV